MTLDAVVRRAIRRAPRSIRALAREVGVSHVFLQGIVTGREKASARVALQVARVLETWAGRCAEEAAAVRAVLKSRHHREQA